MQCVLGQLVITRPVNQIYCQSFIFGKLTNRWKISSFRRVKTNLGLPVVFGIKDDVVLGWWYKEVVYSVISMIQGENPNRSSYLLLSPG